MSLQKCLQNLKTVKRCHLPKPSHRPSPSIAEIVNSITSYTTPSPSPTFLNLTPDSVHRILSDPRLKTLQCLDIFNFLITNQCLISFPIDLHAHLTLIFRLIKERRFIDAESLLNSLPIDQTPTHPFSAIASYVEIHRHRPKLSAKLFNLMLKVYSDNRKFERAADTFDYMKSNGIEINERTCTVHLIALVRDDRVDLGLDFLYRMLDSGIEVSVFSVTVLVDGLCKSGEIKRARELVEEMAFRGVRPNIITCNTLVGACAKRWNFEELDVVLILMEREGVEYNLKTYKFLADGFSSSGKIEEADKVVSEMHSRGLEVDTHLYNLIISGYCKLGVMETAFKVFVKMTDRGVSPNMDTYWTLVTGLCRTGQMEAAKELVDEMLKEGIEMDQVMFDTLIDGYCEKEMTGEACELQVAMAKKGFFAGLSSCDMMGNWLCKLGRTEEAKWLLSMMVKRGVSSDNLGFAPLLNVVAISGSREAVPEDKENLQIPSTDLISGLIDEYAELLDIRDVQNP